MSESKLESKKELRKFGLILGIISVALSAYSIYLKGHSGVFRYSVLIISILLIAVALIRPKLLKLVYDFCLFIAHPLGWLMTRFILGISFYLIVTPLALIAKIFGKHFLDLKPDKSKVSYWHYRDNIQETTQKQGYEKQF